MGRTHPKTELQSIGPVSLGRKGVGDIPRQAKVSVTAAIQPVFPRMPGFPVFSPLVYVQTVDPQNM